MSDGVIDRAVLAELLEALGGDTETLDDILDTFVDDATELVATARTSRDGDDFRRAVHSLKTTSATVGAVELSAVCRRLEEDARAGGVASGSDLDELEGAAERAIEALRDHGTA